MAIQRKISFSYISITSFYGLSLQFLFDKGNQRARITVNHLAPAGDQTDLCPHGIFQGNRADLIIHADCVPEQKCPAAIPDHQIFDGMQLTGFR